MKASITPTRWTHLSAKEINERNWEKGKAILFNFWRELRIIFSGLVLVNLFVIQSILGEMKSIFHPSHPRHSEYSTPKEMIKKRQIWDLTKIIGLHLASIVFFPITIIIFFFIDHKPSETRYVGRRFNLENKCHKERWIFINGVGVHWQFQMRAGRRIANVFQREVRLYHNPTEGIVSDLLECFLGRNLTKFTKIATHFSNIIDEELATYPDHKVIIISHSQGTIITSNAIERLIKANKTNGLERIEVYTFGCAAIDFFVKDNPKAKPEDDYKFIPYYEHFANEYDLIARIGIIRDDHECISPGRVYVHTGKWGHLLSEHYLPFLFKDDFKCLNDLSLRPRLYNYQPLEGKVQEKNPFIKQD